MPAIKPRRSRVADPAAGDPVTRDNLVPAGAGEMEVEQPDILPPSTLDFFEYMDALTPTQWEKRLVYLYRVDPEVRNPENATGKARKFIEKIAHSFDEEYVKKHHGGGGYLAILKNTLLAHSDRGERTKVFYIDGSPKLQPGQTLVNEPAAPAAAAPQNDLGSILQTVLAEVRSAQGDRTPEKAMEVFMSAVTRAQEASQQMLEKRLAKQEDSPTGSSLADQLLKSAIERMANPADPFANITQMFTMMKLMKELQPEQRSNGLGAIVNEVKALTGVDSLADLFNKDGGGADWKAELARAGIELIKALPQTIEGLRAAKRDEFEQAVRVEQFRRSGALPVPVTEDAPAQTPAPEFAFPTNAPRPTRAPGGSLDAARILICKMFDCGSDGGAAARMVELEHPAVLTLLKPQLQGELAQVKAFCASDEYLSGIAGHEEFDDFLADFVDEVLGGADEDEAEGDRQPPPAPAPALKPAKKKPVARVPEPGPQLVDPPPAS